MKDETAVQRILSTIAIHFINPLSPSELISISTGVMATEVVSSDMSNARTKGKAAFEEFVKKKFGNESTLCIFDPIRKLKLLTFSSMNTTKAYKVNSKIVPMQASKELFAKIS